MATIKDDVTLKYQTTVDGAVEETKFSAGDEVTLVQRWDDAGFALIKDGDGHFYNVANDKVED